MAFIEKYIYPKVPVILQNLMISGYGYKWQQRRFGGVFQKELLNYKKREAFSVDEWQNYQTLQLRSLLCHAFKNVPYYQSKYKKLGFTLDDFKTFNIQDLKKLPYLEKEDLRMFGTNTLLSVVREEGGSFFDSSGSTGMPTKILFSKPMHQRWSAAFEARIRNWAMVNYKMSRGMIGGRRVIPDGLARPPYHRVNIFEKQIYFSAYHITPETALDYAKALKKHKPEYMIGYAMSNYFLAKIFLEKSIEVPPVKAVITSSEKLSKEMRDIFSMVYKCKAYDSYSGIEACGLISENEHEQLLISPDVGLTEIVNSDGSYSIPGESGELISTGFLNYDQPLIRYRIGDYVKISTDQKTKCGRQMMVIDEIIGRREDTAIGPDGRLIVRFHGIFIDLKSVIEGQIVQHEIGKFEVRVVCVDKLIHEDEMRIKERMVSQLGDVEVWVTTMKEIPRGANGKFAAVISFVTGK